MTDRNESPKTESAGLGDGGKARASDARQREERTRVAIGSISGDYVSGDKLELNLDGKRMSLLRLGATRIDEVRRAFVKPGGWNDLLAEYHGKRVVVLRAAPDQGKGVAAIRLLQWQSDSPIYNLERDVDLAELVSTLDREAKHDRSRVAGAGFLLLEPSRWATLEGWILERLEAALEAIDARLVLTTAGAEPLRDDGFRRYVLDLGPAPAPLDVFQRHLVDWRLADDTGLGTRLRTDPLTTALTDEYLRDGVPIRTAARLAEVVSQSLDGDVLNVAKVRERMARVAGESFETWFAGLPDVPVRCMAIALAVLNGLPYETVVSAADALTARLDGPPPPMGSGPPWRDPFRRNRRELLRLLQAGVRDTVTPGPFGHTPAAVVEFHEHEFPRKVLAHVWDEFGLHRELLGWLGDLAGEIDDDVRTRAGVAFGALCLHAFTHVWSESLEALAHDPDVIKREVVAYALRAPAARPELRPLVDTVVAGLYGDTESPARQATAARVHGFALGPLGAGAALTALDRLAAVDDLEIAISIADSLSDLIIQDDARNAPLVLSRVSNWQNDRRRAAVGEFVFLYLARSLTTSHRDGDRWVTWPALLIFADERPELRRVLMEMWKHALNSGANPFHVEVALARWAALAETDAGVRTSLARMLAGTASLGERTAALILRLVASWRSPDTLQPKPRTALAVEDALRPARNDVA